MDRDTEQKKKKKEVSVAYCRVIYFVEVFLQNQVLILLLVHSPCKKKIDLDTPVLTA